MPGPRSCDVCLIGGGIVGTATAMELTRRYRASVLVLEAEERLAAHQTGNNSGVVHSGLYYRPGSVKARTCVAGREALVRFCAEHGVPVETCGKVVVATRPEELGALEELARRCAANGLVGVERLGPEGIRAVEPYATGVGGLFVPQTGIVDYSAVTNALAGEVRRLGGEIRTGARVFRVEDREDCWHLETTAGTFSARAMINCAGLQCDRVARMCGLVPDVRIVPFRGEYYTVRGERRHLVKNLVYPVPDPAFPFLGVHFTRRIGGEVEAGPNAVLALRREGYRRTDVSARDTWDTLSYPGFWRLAARHAGAGLGEMWRSWSKRAFVAALQRLVPEIEAADLAPGGAGVRAQALGRDGSLIDDFRILGAERQIHVLNAPSPAATASIAIGRAIAEQAGTAFGLRARERVTAAGRPM
jgi:L-2-hydroxyglutarate oxidase